MSIKQIKASIDELAAQAKEALERAATEKAAIEAQLERAMNELIDKKGEIIGLQASKDRQAKQIAHLYEKIEKMKENAKVQQTELIKSMRESFNEQAKEL